MSEPAQVEWTNAGLVVLAQGGDPVAFEELVRRHQGSVRGLLSRLSGDADLADDLAQETFLQAWRSLSQLRAPGAFTGWLRRIAVNRWIRHTRRSRVPTEPLETDDVASGGGRMDVARRLDLDEALARLKPAERLCIVLAYEEGMSHAEVARATGLPLGTVKSHLARGGARLRAYLEPGSIQH